MCPFDEHAAGQALDGPRLVPDDEVGSRPAGVRRGEGLAGRCLLGGGAGAGVAEPARVVEAGDPHPVHGDLGVVARAVLEQGDVGDAGEPVEQRGVGRAVGVVVAAHEEVRHADRARCRSNRPVASASSTVPKLTRSPASTTTSMPSSCDDRAHQVVLVAGVDVADEQHPQRGVGLCSGAAWYFCCSAVDRAIRLRR